MNRRLLTVLATLAGSLAAGISAAETAVVTVTDSPAQLFDPQTVTIHVGDSVTWNNVSGIHNIFADDGSFTSGSPAAAPWTFTHTFSALGTFGYYCQPHGGPGVGQFGTVVVVPFTAELTNGADRVEDLVGGPDSYRIGQKAYSSYEVVADALGTNTGPVLERVDASGSGVLQGAQPVSAGIGLVLSLRWENASAGTVESERVRVGALCGSNCTSRDAYRLRAYETTLAIPRYNNSGTQVTVLVLQNPTDYPIAGHVYFWSSAGALVNGTGTAFSLQPKASFVVAGSAVPGVPGTAGTLTVSHDGRYGDLVGKAVALEPATGFSFDTPALVRAH